jgi:hypothetical protein
MHITYDNKHGIEYAKLCVSRRIGKRVVKDTTNLGRVLDKEHGIYKNRERGVFTYDLETNTYGAPPVDFIPSMISNRKESLILDFGDSFFLDNFIEQSGLRDSIDAISYGNPDTLYAMIHYYIICSTANCHANDWYEGNYARILYPNANLTSQRISDFLTAIGDEYSQREFFKEYFKWLDQSDADLENVLIDSTGLVNSIQFPLTAVTNHNGQISEEVRLMYVVHHKTGMPIYFRYCAGNIVDVTTLVRCLAELKAQGVNVKFAIFDAGYYSDDNIKELFKQKVSFITRMKPNTKLYKELVNTHADSLEVKENLVEYNTRYAYIKCVPCEIDSHKAYAYIGLDIDRKSFETKRTFRNASNKKMDTDQVFDAIQNKGIFILIATRKIAKTKILPLYYMRQQIEQVFDIGKNYAGMVPVRVHTEETFRGHLLLTFVATAILRQLQTKLIKSPVNPISLFLNLRNHKCKIFGNEIVTHEPVKKANDIYKSFKVTCPTAFERKS